MDYKEQIKENNKTHQVDEKELKDLIVQAKEIFQKNHNEEVFFERSIFINWTCGIADCKYCYLSTKPKLAKHALRSQASILAEALICKLMGWRVGYITGGLGVESTNQLIDLLKKLEIVLGYKIMMNFGPYNKFDVEKFKPYVTGMGSAIESFDEELHNFICPSKPLKALKMFLGYLKENNMKKLITIILGLGEKKEHIDEVIKNIKEYDITILQLCFLKSQEETIFDDVPAPNPQYMAYWIAKIRIACPKIIIKVALVRERMDCLSLLLDAGANGFSRFMVFKDFNTEYAHKVESECKKVKRKLLGNFTIVPQLNIEEEVKELSLDENLKKQIEIKAKQYYEKLNTLSSTNK